MIRKNLDLIIVTGLVLSLVFYDITLDLIASVLHLCLELLHWIYEWFELGIEHSVEHIFHTTRHGSQIITFYILMLIAGLLFFGLWRFLPGIFKAVREFAQQSWTYRKAEWQLYWLSMTLTNKIKLAVTAVLVAYLASFFVM